MRPTVIEVNVKTFEKNVKKIQEYVGNKKIMPVIKANAYGTYINKNLELIEKFDIVGVATVDEAVELRKNGYKKEILVLNQPYIDELEDIIDYDVTIGLSSKEFLNSIHNLKKQIKVHLEIETGMNRTGIKINELQNFIMKIKELPNVQVEGVYTHLSCADYDNEYTIMQLKKFETIANIVKKEFPNIKYIHSSSSNGLLNYDDQISNLVRPGILLYGYKSFEDSRKMIEVEPICKLKTKITFLKEINEGESISYSRKFISNKKMKVATIPIGYADGLRRNLINGGEVVINDKKAKIVGAICMDSCMIDVTDIENVEVGDDVYIWDNNLITLEELAKKSDTINYEIISTISYRVPRVFIKK